MFVPTMSLRFALYTDQHIEGSDISGTMSLNEPGKWFMHDSVIRMLHDKYPGILIIAAGDVNMYGVEMGDQGRQKMGQSKTIRTENNLRQLQKFQQDGIIQALGNHDFPHGGYLPPEDPIMDQYYEEFEHILSGENIHQYWAGNYVVEKQNLRIIVLNTNYLVTTDNNYANEDNTTGDKVMQWLEEASSGIKPCLLVGHHSAFWTKGVKIQYHDALQNTRCVAAWGHEHFTAARANHVMAAGTSSWYKCHIPEVVIAHTCDGINVCKLERIFASVNDNGCIRKDKWEIETINIQNTSVGVQFPNSGSDPRCTNKSPCRVLEEIHDNEDDFMKESNGIIVHLHLFAFLCSLVPYMIQA